jgi:hypothetical protein
MGVLLKVTKKIIPCARNIMHLIKMISVCNIYTKNPCYKLLKLSLIHLHRILKS